MCADDCDRRKPAWTDRILYTNAPPIVVDQNSYSAHTDITISDHRPVSADFLVQVCPLFYD
jgi:inositol polyphosphate 5-phosphatase INPP5B/F